MTGLSGPYDPIVSPTSAGVDPTTLQEAEVLLVHPDGTIDLRLTSSRATRTTVRVVGGGPPPAGARVVVGHLDADPQSPVAFAPPQPPPLSPAQAATLDAGARRDFGADAPSPVESGDFNGGYGVARAAGGTLLTVSFVPAVNCVWAVRGNLIVRTSTEAWGRVDARIKLSAGQDAQGADISAGAWSCVAGHAALGWIGVGPSAQFRCTAGQTYTAFIELLVNSGTWRHYYHRAFTRLDAHVAGFW